MFPWQTVWAPHLNFPWSGSVAQRIEPNTNWFFDSIDVHAGDGRIEKKAFEKASYGKQIGLITEVLLDLAVRENQLSTKAAESLHRLRKINEDIEEIKREEAATTALEIEERLEWLKKNNATEYDLLIRKLRVVMGE